MDMLLTNHNNNTGINVTTTNSDNNKLCEKFHLDRSDNDTNMPLNDQLRMRM